MIYLSKGTRVGDRLWFYIDEEDDGAGELVSTDWDGKTIKYDVSCLESIQDNLDKVIRLHLCELSSETRYFIRDRFVCDLIDEAAATNDNFPGVRHALLMHAWNEAQLIEALRFAREPEHDLNDLNKWCDRLPRWIGSYPHPAQLKEGYFQLNKAKFTKSGYRKVLILAYLFEGLSSTRHEISNYKLVNAIDDCHMYLKSWNHLPGILDRIQWNETELLSILTWCVKNASVLNTLEQHQTYTLIHDQFAI